MTRDEWMNSTEGLLARRTSAVRCQVQLCLLNHEQTSEYIGKTIAQVYNELAEHFDFSFQEVIDCFNALHKINQIYPVNDEQPETARWKVIQ